MTWRNNLRPASFRNVAFEMTAHDFTTGRRGQQHEYAYRDKPYFEDLGLRAGEYTVQAYLVGDDYMQRRDALIKACQQKGAGTLLHAYIGSLEVVCTECKLMEQDSEGRMCRYQLTFAEAGENLFPGSGRDYGYSINRSADRAGDLSVEDFSRRFNVNGLPDYITSDALAVLDDIGNLASGLSGGYNTTRAADLLYSLGPSGLRNGFLVGQRVLNLSRAFSMDYAGNPDRTAYATRTFSQYSTAQRSANVPRTTSTRLQQVQVLDLLGGLVSRVGLAEEGRTFSEREFPSYQDAIGAAQDYAGRLEESHSLPGGISDDTYQGLVQVQADVMEYTTSQSSVLPQLQQVQLPTDRPALVVSYDLYDDARRDADIVARNRVRDPGAVPGGRPLEVVRK